MSFPLVWMILIALLLGACAPSAGIELPTVEIVRTAGLASPAASTTTSSPLPTSTATPTPDPYAGLYIQDLAAREYGGGQVVSLQVLRAYTAFTRYLISYPSDGLAINGFMDVPEAEGQLPVLLLLHGYVDPAVYKVETYTERYAAAFASAGYIVLHPNYRNYPPSDSGPNRFRVGYAIDVLNLIAIVREQAGQPGALEKADAANIFLWGHSMGGGIVQRVLTVGAPVNAAVLYASMSGDERQNFEHILNVLSEGQRGFEELDVPHEALLGISPIYHYERIIAPVSVHHGDLDAVVSLDFCDRLAELGKSVECFVYPNMPHTFYASSDELFIERSLEFFQRYQQ